MALDFDQWRETVLHNYSADLTDQQIASLNELDDQFRSMSKNSKEAWTEQEVREDPEWTEIRLRAAKALQSFGWSRDIPPSYASEYIGGPS